MRKLGRGAKGTFSAEGPGTHYSAGDKTVSVPLSVLTAVIGNELLSHETPSYRFPQPGLATCAFLILKKLAKYVGGVGRMTSLTPDFPARADVTGTTPTI